VFIGLTIGWSIPAAAADCTRAERDRADRQLWLNRRDRDLSIAQHLPWGMPTASVDATRERALVQRDYVIWYDGDLRVPLWTAERIDAGRLGRADREDCFRRDPRLNADLASTPSDYDEWIFDQGHVTASANQTMSNLANHNSFIMSNMTPQFCQFNRGVWQILEGIVRLWADERRTLYVLSGSIFDRNNDGVRDADEAALRMRTGLRRPPRPAASDRRRVAIPSHFYKVIAFEDADGRVQTLSLLFPHDQTDLDGEAALEYLRSRVTQLETIERLAGIDLFPTATVEEATTFWPFIGSAPRSLSIPSSQCQGTAGATLE